MRGFPSQGLSYRSLPPNPPPRIGELETEQGAAIVARSAPWKPTPAQASLLPPSPPGNSRPKHDRSSPLPLLACGQVVCERAGGEARVGGRLLVPRWVPQLPQPCHPICKAPLSAIFSTKATRKKTDNSALHSPNQK